MSKKIVNRGYKFRLYPNAEQRKLINKTIGCARYIYNYGLDLKTSAYKKDKTNLTENDINNPWSKDQWVCSSSFLKKLLSC